MLISNKIILKKPQPIQTVVFKHDKKWKLTEKSVWGGSQLHHSSDSRASSQKKIRAEAEKIENLATSCVVRFGLHGFRTMFHAI
jgi:hypothetical protein